MHLSSYGLTNWLLLSSPPPISDYDRNFWYKNPHKTSGFVTLIGSEQSMCVPISGHRNAPKNLTFESLVFHILQKIYECLFRC